MDAVIVTHDSSADLRRQLACLPLRAAFGRLFVVDNGSADASVQIAELAGATVVCLPDNPGFGAAVNRGARETSGDYFAILNPDIEFESEDVVAKAAAVFERFPRVGVIAPKLILPDGSVQDSFRSVPTPGQLVARRMTRSPLGAVDAATAGPVPWAVGACLFVRRSAFADIGGFDPRYRVYFEDVDLCVRLARAGWETWAHPEIRVLHRHAAESRKSIAGRAMREHVRSAAMFYMRNPRHLTRS
jgi:GT2 family glycosyltransferase